MNEELIYFNNAATSWPKPKQIYESVMNSWLKPYHEHGRSSTQDIKDYVTIARNQLASFFHCDTPNHFIFTSSATDSLNMLIQGYIKNKEKMHVITTELEHNSVLRPLNTLEKEKIIDLSIIPFNNQGYVTLNTIKEAIQNDTGLVVLNHGSNVLGTLQDIETIGQYLKNENIFFIVDSAQSVGHVDIDLRTIPLDGLVFTGHKGLYGFQGIGGFFVKNPHQVLPLKQGGTGVFSQDPFQPDEMPLKFESGTPNYPGIVSLFSGLQFIKEIGLHSIKEKSAYLTDYLLDQLAQIESIILYNEKPDLPIIPFNIEGLSHDDVGFILLNQFNIITRTGLHCAPLVHKRIDDGKGCVRLSCSFFNTIEECNRVIEALKKITGTSFLKSNELQVRL